MIFALQLQEMQFCVVKIYFLAYLGQSFKLTRVAITLQYQVLVILS